MRNDTTLIDEVFSSIDEMDSITMESSLEVMNSLLESYDKALTIMENYEGDDLEAFSVYQEGKIMDDVKEMGKDQGMIMRIISFIPRLLIAIGRAIKNAWKGGEPAKKASSAAERVMKWGQDVKDFATSLFTVDKDNTGKIVGITVAGVAISGAVVASWIAARKGIFEKLGNSFKSFWTNKVAAFFSKGITPEDVPSKMEEVGNINYTDSTDKWTTLFNLDAVLKFFTEPKAIIENIGRISAIGGDKDSTKVYDEYLTKLDNVRKLKIVSKNPVSFSTADINKYFKDIDTAITSLGDTAEKSWDNANKLLRNAKEGDLKNVDKNALKKFEAVVKTLGVYAGIVPGLVKFVGEFSKAYDDLIRWIEKMKKKAEEQASNGESSTSEESTTSTDEGTETSEEPKEEPATEENPVEDESKIEKALDEYWERVEEYKKKNGGEISRREAIGIARDITKSYGIPFRKFDDALAEENSPKNISKAQDEYKKWGASYRSEHNGETPSKSVKKNKRKEIAIKYNVDIDHVHEYMDEDINDDDDVITESVSNGWYSR